MKKWVLLTVLLFVVTGVAQAIPNPSAWYCILQGYEYEIRTDEQGGQYGVCVFPDGSECSTWHYYCKCEPDGIGCWPGDFNCHWPCKEMRCKEAGESVLVSTCCEGLDEIYPSHIFDTNCNKLALVGWLFLCSDCGNGICEDWESRCNCPGDCAQPHIIYADNDSTGANDGSSWADAYNCLQDALTAASSGDEIRVAQGIYKSDQGTGFTSGDREATFQLISGATLKGGYAGFGELDPNVRDIEAYETILSGDLNGDDVDVNGPADLLDEPTRGENSYHVVTGSGTDETAVLDGLTIMGGNANGHYYEPNGIGAGMYNDNASPTITNCTFSRNSTPYHAGGMFNNYSSPMITNCTFSENCAHWDGSCIYNVRSSPMVIDCTFISNIGEAMYNINNSSPIVTNCTFSDNNGGGMYNVKESSPAVTNCIFTDNWGSGMLNDNSSNPTVANCTFTGNSSSSGGGVQNYTSSPTLINCTFRGNLAPMLHVGFGIGPGYGGGIYRDVQQVQQPDANQLHLRRELSE